MNYLLDTHVFVWARLSPQKLSSTQREIITSPSVQKYISTLSIWEISLKFGLGKFELGGHTPEELLNSAISIGFGVMAPEAMHFASFYRLPKVVKHKDPFDRMLIWQATQQNLTLLSHDKAMPSYKIYGLNLA